MGKKDKNKKKGKGAEKTAMKTEKKLSAKQKKELMAKGEDDIENILAQIQKEEKNKLKTTEHRVGPPSRRVNCSFIPHPDKDELILFGGEYFNGQTTFLYNDLFFYNIAKNDWNLLKAPAGPPPRCAHQSVAISAGKGQLWIFGGEFASKTQSQFYHYNDLWLFHLSEKRWQQIKVPGGPSPRSGHRMVYLKKQLFVFGGYHDNLRDYKYFNDIYVFDLEEYKWRKLEPAGIAPHPRSGCVMIPISEGKIMIYGGYSKEKMKKDVDKGTIHNDMFYLKQDKLDKTKWKWTSVKQHGIKPTPRCGMSSAIALGNKTYTFGGVYDLEADDEDLEGTFFNELYMLDLERSSWNIVNLNEKKEAKIEEITGENDSETKMETEPITISDDGVFKVTLGSSSALQSSNQRSISPKSKKFTPCSRMSCCIAIKRNILYLFGGLYEDGEKQLTFGDFYSLDLNKLDEWKTIIEDYLAAQEWIDSESSSEGSENESEDEESEEMDVD